MMKFFFKKNLQLSIYINIYTQTEEGWLKPPLCGNGPPSFSILDRNVQMVGTSVYKLDSMTQSLCLCCMTWTQWAK